METESQQQLHIFFFPFMAPGHTIPVIQIAKQFASYSVKSTILTTPLNAPQFSKAIQRSKHLGFDHEIELLLLKFPSIEAGLPQECESYNLATLTLEMELTFFKAITLLEPQFEQVLDQHRPHCLVVDTMFPWATIAASKFGIPSLLFHGTGFFSLCASKSIIIHQPHLKLSSDSESVVIPDLPVEIKIKGSQIPSYLKLNLVNEFTKLFRSSKDAEDRSYGVIVNSFYELEPDYADHYRKMFGKKIWIIGPGSLYNKVAEHKAEMGCMESIEEVHECLYWLNSKKPKTVVYVCFGSLTNFNDFQLLEIAVGLEASGQEFIWVVNKEKKDKEEWLPEGFEQRMEGKGLIIRGWAPQVHILEHEAIGGFVTHCGWNSILEGVSAGVPMITWPVSAEQTFNEKLVTEILRTGVAVGADIWGTFADEIVKMEAGVKRVAIEKSVSLIMVGDEAEGMRNRAKELGNMARKAVEEGGSSFKDLRALIAELRSLFVLMQARQAGETERQEETLDCLVEILA